MFAKSNQKVDFKKIDWLHSQAVAKHKQGEKEEAIAFYLESIEVDENQPDWVYANTIILLVELGHLDRALELGERAQKIYANNDKILPAIALTISLLDQERIDEAIALFKEAIALNPNLAWPYIKLGGLYQKKHQYEQALQTYEQAILIDRKQIWACLGAIEVLKNDKKFEEALNKCQQGLKFNPDNERLELLKLELTELLSQTTSEKWQEYAHLAQQKLEERNDEEAIALYEQAVNLNPNEAWPYLKLADLYKGLFNRQKRLDFLKKAVDIEPTNIWGYISLVKLLREENKLEEALEKCEEGLQFHPDHEKIQTLKQAIEKEKEPVRLIAFFLPQYHPIPENDRWWGKGFTEWTNVTKAKPLFEGHYQPRLPSDLGFYDLRLPEVRDAQARLAKKYGVYGFCYYYYWFAGKRLLDRPIDEILQSKHPDFPFCLCWANENWTRRWDGSENEILIAQEHSFENNKAFAESLVPFMKDERYIKVKGKPLVLIYRANILPDIEETVKLWRDIWRTNGIGEVYLCGCLGFKQQASQVIEWGFDAGVEFPPHDMGTESDLINPTTLGANDFQGHFFDCRSIVEKSLKNKLPSEKEFLSVMASWDNTARRGTKAHVFLNNDPQMYELWLRGVIEKTKQIHSESERLVFINAWNEWAEGTYLEPDSKYGHGYLSATSRALNETYSWHTSINLIRYLPIQTEEHLTHLINELQLRIELLQRSIEVLIEEVNQKKIGYSLSVIDIQYKNQEQNTIYFDSPTINNKVNSNEHLSISGWCFNAWGKKVKKIRICRNKNIVLADIGVYINRPDIGKVYPQCKQLDVGFVAWIRVEYLLTSEPESTLQAFSVLENGQAVESADLDLSIKKEKEIKKKISAKLRTKIKSYYAQKSEVSSMILQLRAGKESNNFDDILDELEEIVKQWQAIPSDFDVYID